MTDYVMTILVASLLGSVHCAAMCGGLVSALSLSGSGRSSSVAVGFHTGRLLTYLTLGMLAGSLGRAVDAAGQHAGLVGSAASIAGAVVALSGLAALIAATAQVRLPRLGFVFATQSWLSERVVAKRLAGPRASQLQGFVLGLSSALLPCGWLYAFVVSAAGTANALYGALLMFAFWLGTVPALLGVGAVVRRLSAPLKRHVPVLSAALLVVVGLSAVLFRVNVPAAALANIETSLGGEGAHGAVAPSCH